MAQTMAMAIDETGVTCGGRRVEWSEVLAVLAYKVDCYTFDQIRVAFLSRTGDVLFEVTDDSDVQQPMMERLPEFLPGALRFEQWFFDVAFPAFAENQTLIYRRDA